MKKLLATIFVSLVIAFPASSFASSALVIDYAGAPGPLFAVSNAQPGQLITKKVTITNFSDTTQSVKFRVTSQEAIGKLASKITLEVKNSSTLEEKINDSLANIYEKEEIDLGTLVPKVPSIYEFNIFMDRDIGNEYSNLIEKFNMEVGFSASSITNIDGVPHSVSLLTRLTDSLGFENNAEKTVSTSEESKDQSVKGETAEVKSESWWNKQIFGLRRWVWFLLIVIFGGLVIVSKKTSRIKKKDTTKKDL